MSHKLLLADDSATIQRVIELTFSGEDVEVVAVGDGEQAIARIPVERPDIVLADIGMPKRSGYDVAAFVKGHPDLRHIPVLLLAGAFEPVDEARAQQVGSDGVLVKPFEPQHVIARVRELLQRARRGPAEPAAEPPRPVERPAGARTLEFPQRPEPPAAVSSRDRVEDELRHEPASERAASPASVPGESLDDYFDRLDAAFTSLDAPSIATPDIESSRDLIGFDERLDVPTLDEILGPDFTSPPAPVIDLPLYPPPVAVPPETASVAPPPVEPPDITATRAPQGADRLRSVRGVQAAGEDVGFPAGPGTRSVIADAFAALLAVEQGEPGAVPVRLIPANGAPAITDAMLDEIARRVVERLAPDVVRDVVTQVVSDIAERLVREEIQRIRSRQ